MSSPVLEPFAGNWNFEFEKTLSQLKSNGAPDDQLEQLRSLYGVGSQLGQMHPNLSFEGNVAVGSGALESEYRFFALHDHDGKLCGKAWHHEDRFDPGDMSKCLVRLSLVDQELHLELCVLDGLPSLSGPDLLGSESLEGDISQCEASEKPARAWTTFVFSRPSEG